MVQFNDVTLRDGQQSLLSGRLRQKDVNTLAPLLEGTGFKRYEVWGGTTYEMPITFKGEDPWRNLDEIRAAMPTSNLSMLLRGQSLVSRHLQSDATVSLFVLTAARHGINTFRIFDALNDIDNLLPALKAVKEARAKGYKVEAQGAICYTTPVKLKDGRTLHTTADMVTLARQLHDHGADSICIKDMAGLLEPDAARELIDALKKALPGVPVALHMHASMGRSDASLKAAIEAGVDEVDTTSCGLAYGSGHSASEDILAWLEKTHPQQAPKLDKAKLAATRAALRTIRPVYVDKEVPYDPAIEQLLKEAQVPGGMTSTMKNNIRTAIGKNEELVEECFVESLKEMVRVRADVGYPTLVTPTSQVVMTQAVNNVLSILQTKQTGQAAESARYTMLRDDFIQLVLGHYGKLPGPVDPALKELAIEKGAEKGIAELPADKRPAELLDGDLKKIRGELAVKLGEPKKKYKIRDEDLLTYLLYPDAGLKFLKHRFGIQSQKFESPAELPALPDPITYHGRPRPDAVMPIALPYIDELVHLAVEKARIKSGFVQGDTGFLAGQIESRMAEARGAMFTALAEIGKFNASTLLPANEAINRCIAERGKLFGLEDRQLPLVSFEDLRAAKFPAMADPALRGRT